MDTDTEDVWTNWLGLSSQTILSIKKSQKGKKSLKRKNGVSPVEEHIKHLTDSLTKTQAALEKAGEVERLTREQHRDCSEALTRQGIENGKLQEQVKKLCQEVEECRTRSDGQTVVNGRLKERLHELVRMVREVEQEAEDCKYVLENERLVHVQEREELRMVHAAHEDCLASLKAAQESLVGYQEEVATRNGIIQSLKRHKSGITTKLTNYTTSLRRTSGELEDSQKNLTQVSEQLQEAEKTIQQQITMLSSLEAYKQQLLEEVGSLRSDYEDRTLQLVKMRETLLERNSVISDLRDQLEQRDSQLRFYNTRTAFIRRELVDTTTELAESKSAIARAEKTIDVLKGAQDGLREEKDSEIAALCKDKADLKTALDVSRDENGNLRSDLEAVRAQLNEKDEKLATEKAAHARTAEAATAQKLQLQASIENLKKSLAVANNDLARARETLFELNEKTQNVCQAQRSLAEYQRHTKIVLDNSPPSLERHDSGIEVDPEQGQDADSPSLQSTDLDTVPVQEPRKQCVEREYSHAKKVDMRRVRARQEVIKNLRKSALSHKQSPDSPPRGPNSIFEPLAMNPVRHSNFSRPLTPKPRGASSGTQVVQTAITTSPCKAARAEVPAPTAHSVSLKRVRFAVPADEGYQTDEMQSPMQAVFEDISVTDESTWSPEAILEESSAMHEMRSPLQAVPEGCSTTTEMPECSITNEMRSPLQAIPEERSTTDEVRWSINRGLKERPTTEGRVWELVRDLEQACTAVKTLKRRKSREDLRSVHSNA